MILLIPTVNTLLTPMQEKKAPRRSAGPVQREVNAWTWVEHSKKPYIFGVCFTIPWRVKVNYILTEDQHAYRRTKRNRTQLKPAAPLPERIRAVQSLRKSGDTDPRSSRRNR